MLMSNVYISNKIIKCFLKFENKLIILPFCMFSAIYLGKYNVRSNKIDTPIFLRIHRIQTFLNFSNRPTKTKVIADFLIKEIKFNLT
jgi:hypothetical protein